MFNVICMANGVEYRTSTRSWDAMLSLAARNGWNPSGPRHGPSEAAPLVRAEWTGPTRFNPMYDPQDMAPSDAASLAEHLNAVLASRDFVPPPADAPIALGDSMNPLDYFIANATLTVERVREFADFVRDSEGFCFMTDET